MKLLKSLGIEGDKLVDRDGKRGTGDTNDTCHEAEMCIHVHSIQNGMVNGRWDRQLLMCNDCTQEIDRVSDTTTLQSKQPYEDKISWLNKYEYHQEILL